jgi:hypothetical protein
MADALTAPANTKRRRQVEGRQQLLFGSAMSAIPEASRPEVQESARRYAARRWYVYVPCVVMAAWVLLVQFWPGLPGGGHNGVIAGAPMTALIATLMLQRRVIHSYVKREAEKYRSIEVGGGVSANV